LLKSFFTDQLIEAGCDEAGRGCLAGPVFASAVILSKEFTHPLLNDSKKLSANQRNELRIVIEKEALSFAVASCDHLEIDELNILKASITAMHRAVSLLHVIPELLLIDGNRFIKYKNIPHHCIIKGDGLFFSIAAASVLAKTYRDDFMLQLNELYPDYHWNVNKGYPTATHKEAIRLHGITPFHRKSFNLNEQMKLVFD
jgi:ribonuclease HII